MKANSGYPETHSGGWSPESVYGGETRRRSGRAGLDLSEKESRVLELVREHWPISALEIAEHLNEDFSSAEHRKRHSTNYTYYLKKLVGKRLVLSKRVGNALIVWPLEAEAYRAIHRIVRGDQ